MTSKSLVMATANRDQAWKYIDEKMYPTLKTIEQIIKKQNDDGVIIVIPNYLVPVLIACLNIVNNEVEYRKKETEDLGLL